MDLLAGITVLDLSLVGPATRGSRLLADYGAEVVKVGPPPSASKPAHELAFHAYSGGRGLRRARIDLRSPLGVEAFRRLAAGADVVLESFRPGVAQRLGVGYEDVRQVNPAIVYCSTSGYGQTGPHAQRAGHDLNYLAAGGFLHTSGRDRDGRPALPGATVADIAAGGMQAAAAILAALVGRARTGEGAYLDVAVTEGVAWMLSLYVDDHLATGTQPGPGHDILTGRYACYGVYPARDARWLAVAAIEPVFWTNLCRALDLEHWIPHQTDDAQQPAIRADLERIFAREGRDAWVAKLADADTCVGPVNDVAEVVADPQMLARGAVVEAEHLRHGRFRQLGPVLAGTSRSGRRYQLPDPDLSDTDELLRRAGYTADELRALHDEDVIA